MKIVSRPSNQKYLDNFDRIFRKVEEDRTNMCEWEKSHEDDTRDAAVAYLKEHNDGC